MDKFELKRRTKTFAHNCVNVSLLTPKNKLGSHIEGQLIRCSTSVAANYRAAVLVQSTASFSAKLSIVFEEVDESDFWLESAIDEGILSNETTSKLTKKAKELTAIFIASRKTIQSKRNNH